MDEIVSMVEYQGKLMLATPQAVYDITDSKNPIVITTSKALDQMLLGKKYVVQEIKI